MNGSEPRESEPETREAIMQATYRALCEHGYANLTTQRIADELGKSTALLHYYYESKEDMLVAFLEYLLTHLDTKVSDESATPREKLDVLVDALLPGPDDSNDFTVAMLEMKAQAPYNEAFQEQFRANDERFSELVERLIEEGIESGQFGDVDPKYAAEHLHILIEGARNRAIVLDEDEPKRVGRKAIDDFLESLETGGENE